MNRSRDSIAKLAQTYYEAVLNKNVPHVAALLHPEVSLLGPLGNATGKEAVLGAITGFANFLRSLRVKAIFASEDQAMVNYDVDFGGPFGVCRSAALLSFRVDTIASIELFFDARPFGNYSAKADPTA